jgi:hypothetical protein
MILKSILGSMCLLVITANLDLAQTNDPAQLTTWGRSVQGVQLSIRTTNSVFKGGEEACIETIITNSATNAVLFFRTGRDTDFDVLLTNGSGSGYHLTPRFISGSISRVIINPTTQIAETIPLTIGTNIEPGDYTLQAYRGFMSNDVDFRVESNPLKVHVK